MMDERLQALIEFYAAAALKLSHNRFQSSDGDEVRNQVVAAGNLLLRFEVVKRDAMPPLHINGPDLHRVRSPSHLNPSLPLIIIYPSVQDMAAYLSRQKACKKAMRDQIYSHMINNYPANNANR